MEIKRHESNKGSVIQYEWLGKSRRLFVADAKFRSYQRFGTDSTEIENISFELKKFTKMISPFGILDNNREALNYNMDGLGLANQFTNVTERNAKDNTDLLMLYGETDAAHWCRCQDIDGVGQLDLPTTHEVMLVYVLADNIDALDPTLSEYPCFALGAKNPDGRFGFCGKNAAWTSVEKDTTGANAVRNDGLISTHCKGDILGVIPVKELESKVVAREVKRHPNNQGSVITLNIYGKVIGLFVADAKYRARKIWGDVVLESKFFTEDLIYVNPCNIPDSQFDNLSYLQSDDQLQKRFKSFYFDKTAFENTNILVQHDNCDAAMWCRSQEIEGIGSLDLPNIYETIAIYQEADRIDALDPTLGEYPDFALGIKNPDGRFNSKYYLEILSSTQCNKSSVRVVNHEGYVFMAYKNNLCGVVPVKEI